MLTLQHCVEFNAIDIWYLQDIKEFENRTLALGRCPKCKKQVVVLREINKQTKKAYKNILVGNKALEVIKTERKRVKYSALEIKTKNIMLGFRFGVNKERLNKKNKVSSIKQFSCDFYGNKKLVKKIKNKLD